MLSTLVAKSTIKYFPKLLCTRTNLRNFHYLVSSKICNTMPKRNFANMINIFNKHKNSSILTEKILVQKRKFSNEDKEDKIIITVSVGVFILAVFLIIAGTILTDGNLLSFLFGLGYCIYFVFHPIRVILLTIGFIKLRNFIDKFKK
jgi:hypothetical protein